MHPGWLVPRRAVSAGAASGAGDALAPGVGAVMTSRHGGVSRAPWESMNLGAAVGDDPSAVAANRAAFARAIGAAPVWLRQVHGTRVVRVGRADAADDAPPHDADACVTTEPGVACVVQVADCLPLLFADRDGRAVAAAHAGWRGLAAGVAEATLRAVCDAASCEPAAVRVWLGACIGPRRFEVGANVVDALGADPRRGGHARFVARGAAHPGKWLANLPGLARDRLAAAGAGAVSGGGWCTVADASRFFSFRRDGVTGRMAAAVWMRG